MLLFRLCKFDSVIDIDYIKAKILAENLYMTLQGTSGGENKMDIKKYKCTECGASLDIKDDMDTIYCSYCGTKNYIDDAASNITRVEKAKLKARKEFHNQNMQEKVDKINFIKTIFKKSEEEKKKETRFLIIFYSIFFLIMIVGITCAIIMAPKNPSLEAYNSLKLMKTLMQR